MRELLQVSRHSESSGQNGCFYTDTAIAKLLIESMALRSPKITIDLGAGSGVLVGEAGLYWKETAFITVDIDQAAASSELRTLRGPAFTHHTIDALDESLAEKIGLCYGDVDSALCNPPYVRPEWRKHFADILEDAGLSHVIPKIGGVQADILFIAQNLRFLSTGGRLGLILPDGVIAGEKHAKLRQILATTHKLERIIELPRRVFRKTDAKAHIVVLTKNIENNDDIKIQKLNNNGILSEPIRLNSDQAGHRLDYSYLASTNTPENSKNRIILRDVTEIITRGSYSSSQRKHLPFPVFHTTDFSDNNLEVPNEFILSNKNKNFAKGFHAKTGDILIARVGRNLESKIGYVTRGEVVVSDCIFIIRVKHEYRMRILNYLTSTTGRISLQTAAHGVGARFITTEALLHLEI